MAATVTAQPPSRPPVKPAAAAMRPDALTHIDLSTLSQSELQALSLFSTSSTAKTLISPQIDPSLFNESSGSHRQTYSAAAASHHRRRAAAVHPDSSSTPPPANPSAADLAHNRLIIDRLKALISRHPSFHSVHLLSPAPPPLPPPPQPPAELKRKRGRKPKASSVSSARESRPEFSVDLTALAEIEDPYGEELRRRTAGLESEEGLLDFMTGVEGEWGSRRKRRRIVDAGEFGEFLPNGWKILLGIRRKEGSAWIYCRRYISPTGQHFVTCKDVALYLQSIGDQNRTQHPDYGHSIEDIQNDVHGAEIEAGPIFKDGDQRQELQGNNEMILLGIQNLLDVQIRELFECHKCNLTFDEKDSYLQHLLSVHQRTTRRYRLGSSVSEGVILKDGKYECQFCHKVFTERRRYNGHVGTHVRNNVRRADEDIPAGSNNHQRIESPNRDDSSPKISKMDALVEIAQNSMLESSDRQGFNDSMVDQKNSEDMEQIDLAIDVEMVSALDNTHRPIEKENDIDPDNTVESKMDVGNTACDPSLPCFPTLDETAVTVEQIFGVEPSGDDDDIDDATGFEDLKLEEIESLKYGFVDGDEECVGLQDVPIDLANSSEMESVLAGSSVQLESEEVMLNADHGHPETSVCVWCGIEFGHEIGFDSESQQESVGFMCRSCKSKVTAQQDELDNGSPLHPGSL